jgi:hypothetical protein
MTQKLQLNPNFVDPYTSYIRRYIGPFEGPCRPYGPNDELIVAHAKPEEVSTLMIGLREHGLRPILLSPKPQKCGHQDVLLHAPLEIPEHINPGLAALISMVANLEGPDQAWMRFYNQVYAVPMQPLYTPVEETSQQGDTPANAPPEREKRLFP